MFRANRRMERCARLPGAGLTYKMMLSALVLLLGSSMVNSEAPTIVNVDGDELTVMAGSTVSITCRHSSIPVAWCTDHNLPDESFTETIEPGHPQPYASTLIIPNVNYTYVGYLSCLHNNTANRQDSRCQVGEEDVASVYLYVKDVHNLLVKEARTGHYSAPAGRPYTLECKPTFPEVNVTIDKLSNNFNPRKGFTILPEEKLDLIHCSASYGTPAVTDIRLMVLNVVDTTQETLQIPEVVAYGAWQENSLKDEGKFSYDVIEGQTVNLTCDININTGHAIHLHWDTPPHVTNQTGNHQLIRSTLKNTKKKFRSLIITNIKADVDHGDYSCIAKLGGISSEPGIIDLNVVRKNESYLELEFDGMDSNITHREKTIKWKALYRAYPEPSFKWYRGNSEENPLVDSSNVMIGEKRYNMTVDHEFGSLDLAINDPKVSDIGEYTLQATAKDKTLYKKMFFTMPAEPENIHLEASNDQLMQTYDSMFTFTCEASGYPKPHLHLEFMKCFGKDNCTEFIEQKTEAFNDLEKEPKDDPTQMVIRKAEWNGRAKVQGFYRCTAENDYRDVSAPKQAFLVTDGEDTSREVSVEVKGDPSKVMQGSQHLRLVEGHEAKLLCRANKMRVSQHPRWKMHEGDKTTDWEGNVKETNTPLSYISEIDIEEKVKQVGDFQLTCRDDSIATTVSIKVIPKSAPSWLNGKKSPLEKSYKVKEASNLNLSCPAHGHPTPDITWYMNDVKLTEELKHRHIQGAKISFDYMQTSDSGTYKCEAKNRVDTLTAETMIMVEDPGDAVIFYILGVVGVLIFILVIIITIFCRKIYKDRKRALDLQLKDQQMFNDGDPASLNPEISLDQQAELLPYNTKYEIPRDSIIFDKLLGAGAFGRVYRATAINLVPGQARTTVAVKMMKSRTDSAQLKALRSEVKIMVHIGRHINIVNLLGAHSKDLASKGELLLVVEYCHYGNILDYMRRHRREFINQINDEDMIDTSITELRIRQRSGSGSRSRNSRSLKYAHLCFNQNSVQYTPGTPTTPSTPNTRGLTPEYTNSDQAFLPPSTSPLPSPGLLPGEVMRETFRSRSISASSNHPITSDMSNMTCESSNGGSDGYISSRTVGGHLQGLCSKDLLGWSYQIAKGMEYLAFKKVLHGDLAARNVLLAENNVVKISDFGLAKDIYKNENYKKKSDGPLPVKWLALECLQDRVFSTQSDVWSFGVVMWELFTLGQVPYPGVEYDENFVAKLEKGVRLDQPRYSTYRLYRVMLECWNGDPMDRPSFTDLEHSLGEMLGDAERQHYLELNEPYQEDNPESSLLDMLQSPDYAAQIQTTSNLDEDGYEMPFSPSPCGAVALPPIQVHSDMTPRHTPMQMQFCKGSAGPMSSGSDTTYVPMSTPTRTSQSIFNFDQDAVTNIARRESEVMQERLNREFDEVDSVGNGGDIYLKMDSGSCSFKPNTPAQQNQSPGTFKVNEGPLSPRPHPQGEANSPMVLANPPISMRHKLVRRPSEMEKHDSGLYSPTALMQTNPSYIMMNGFVKTDENNYISKEDTHDLKHATKPMYENFKETEKVGSPVNRDYLGEGKTEEEYANLLPYNGSRNRTVSEASSGIGSINGESPPTTNDKFGSLKHSLKEKAIVEEPVMV